jgi:hypothetical protein
MKNEIVLYQVNELDTRIEVRIEDETVWLTQEQMASLFGRNRVAITQHIGNIFKEGELDKKVVSKDFLLTTQHGAIKGKSQTRKIKLYNLDVIISVGYRVKSKQGTQFRIWANNIIKDYLLKGYAVNKRIDRLEDNVHKIMGRVDEIDLQIKSNLPPKQGIFFDGQVFDAYVFVANLIKNAKNNIILIDNYIDESVLQLFSKRKNHVIVKIYTKNICNDLIQDLKIYNSQYPTISVHKFKAAHDRFLIIDEAELYHFGASLKDLGKKWFAFSRMDFITTEVLQKLNKTDGN